MAVVEQHNRATGLDHCVEQIQGRSPIHPMKSTTNCGRLKPAKLWARVTGIALNKFNFDDFYPLSGLSNAE
jgi:hypothetical protein